MWKSQPVAKEVVKEDFIRAQSESVHYLAYNNAKTLYYTLIKSTITSQISVHTHQKEVKADKKD